MIENVKKHFLACQKTRVSENKKLIDYYISICIAFKCYLLNTA